MTRISRATILPKGCGSRERGFSLIEVLIVIGLVALVTGMGVSSLTSAFRTSAEAFARQLSMQIGQARDRAYLADKLVRLRVDFGKQTFMIEEAPSNFLVPKTPDKDLSEREKEELAKKEEGVYSPIPELMSSPREMPTGLKMTEVTSSRLRKPAKEGIVDIYFFANGNNDGATLYFETDEQVGYAIRMHPVTGLTRFESKKPEVR